MNKIQGLDFISLQAFADLFFFFCTIFVVKDAKAFASGNTIVQFVFFRYEAISERHEETNDSTECNHESNEVLVEDIAFSIVGKRWYECLKCKDCPGGQKV